MAAAGTKLAPEVAEWAGAAAPLPCTTPLGEVVAAQLAALPRVGGTLHLPPRSLITVADDPVSIRDGMVALVNAFQGHSVLVLLKEVPRGASALDNTPWFPVAGTGETRRFTAAQFDRPLGETNPPTPWVSGVSMPFICSDPPLPNAVHVVPRTIALQSGQTVTLLEVTAPVAAKSVFVDTPKRKAFLVAANQLKMGAHRLVMTMPYMLSALGAGTYEPSCIVVEGAPLVTRELATFHAASEEGSQVENKGHAWYFRNQQEPIALVQSCVAEYAHTLLSTGKPAQIVLGVLDAPSALHEGRHLTQPLVLLSVRDEDAVSVVRLMVNAVHQALRTDPLSLQVPSVYPSPPSAVRVQVTHLKVHPADLLLSHTEDGRHVPLVRTFATGGELADFARLHGLATKPCAIVPLLLFPSPEGSCTVTVALLANAPEHLQHDGFAPLTPSVEWEVALHLVVHVNFPASERVHIRPAASRFLMAQPPVTIGPQPWPLSCMTAQPASLDSVWVRGAVHVLLDTTP
ncbi:hypothetical protein EON62_03625, partial [archaeon]